MSDYDRAHRPCWAGDHYEHVCQEPSGRTCIEDGCGEPAGTWWGPFWCPAHDVERLDNVMAGLQSLQADLRAGGDR